MESTTTKSNQNDDTRQSSPLSEIDIESDNSDDGSNNSNANGDGGASDATPPAVEWLATGRQRRATAGNRMKSMLATEEPDSDLELLFAEDDDDQGFSDAGDDGSDVHMDSSSDDEDGNNAGDDLEGEKELERQAKEKRAVQRKRKAQEAIPAKFRKKVRINPSTGSSQPSPAPRPKKKSERASWLPSPADLPTRASSRSTTRMSKEQLHQQMVEREARRLKQLAQMEKKAAKLEALKKPPMTQDERLREAELVEKRNSKSLNRWEEAEKQREEDRRAKLAALNERTLKGPVITFWSGRGHWANEELKGMGKVRVVEEQPRKKREKAEKGCKQKSKAKDPTEAHKPQEKFEELKGDDVKKGSTNDGLTSQSNALATKDVANECNTGQIESKENTSILDKAQSESKGNTSTSTMEQDGSNDTSVEEKSAPTESKENTLSNIPQNETKEGDVSMTVSETRPQVTPPPAGVSATIAPQSPPPDTLHKSTEGRHDDSPKEASLTEATSNDEALPETSLGSTTSPRTSGLAAPTSLLPPTPIPSSHITYSQSHSHLAAPGSISSLPDVKPSGVLAAPILVLPPVSDSHGLSQTTSEHGVGSSKSNVLAPPNTSQSLALSPLPNSAPSQCATTASPVGGLAAGSSTATAAAPPNAEDTPTEKATAPTDLTNSDMVGSQNGPKNVSSGHRNAIIYQNFNEYAIKDKSIQTQILFGRKMNKLAKPSSAPLCVVTHHAARYRDPQTGLPYYNVSAYREIQRLHKGNYRWSKILGAWVGSGAVASKGVPERFLNPNAEPPVAKDGPAADISLATQDTKQENSGGERLGEQATPVQPKLEPTNDTTVKTSASTAA